MLTPEYLLYPIIANTMNQVINFRTGYIVFDFILIGIIMILLYSVDGNTIKKMVKTLYRKHIMTNYIKNKIILVNETTKERSYKFRAIMHYMARNRNKTVYSIKEVSHFGWDNDDQQRELSSEYIVDQEREFTLSDNIYGSIIVEEKEKIRKHNDRSEMIDMNVLTIYSDKYDLLYLQDWIEKRVEEYKQYVKHKSTDGQHLITVSQGKDDLEVEGAPWESTVTFENSYFHNKDNILQKIDFFLNNKQWYMDRGIPYNLGILLYGEPGCGKTRFIKQLMNHTKRHGIDIKLCDNFDFNELKDIIYNEEIDYNYIIPQDQRIIIFEDIDAMGDVIKERKEKNIKKYKEKKENDENDIISVDSDEETTSNKKILEKMLSHTTKTNNNNLSFLLNILDGLNECSGRIIIMTTNKIDHLDKALIRPGRIDIKIEFQRCTTNDIMHMIQMFWKIDITDDMMRQDIDMKYTSAEVINIFRTTYDFEDIKHEFLI